MTSLLRSVVRPPVLNTGETRTASRLELFFDLAYVLVISELAGDLVEHLTWAGLAAFAGLFTVVWVSWVGFTLYANRFDTDDVVYRLLKLVATAGIAGCAASATGATGDTSTQFEISFLLARAVLFLMYLRAWRHVARARRTVGVYLVASAVAASAWAVAVAVAAPWTYALWVVAVLADLAAPLVATRARDAAPLHMEHLPERFALLVILVLGELVAGAVTAVHDTHWAAASVVAGALGFVIAGALWWVYFDAAAPVSQEQLEEAEEEDAAADDPGGAEVDERHDLFVYGHLPLTLGVVMAGVAVEELALHPGEPLQGAGGFLGVGGLALFVAGVATVVAGTAASWRRAWPWPLAALPAIGVLAVLPTPAGTFLPVAALVLVATAVAGTRQRLRAHLP